MLQVGCFTATAAAAACPLVCPAGSCGGAVACSCRTLWLHARVGDLPAHMECRSNAAPASRL